MKPAPFKYVRPVNLDEATAHLSHGATLLAGGQSLVPMLNLRVARPSTIVDISGLPGLSTISSDGASVSIGALTTHTVIETLPWAGGMDVLAVAAGHIGYPAIRNRGTIGGSIAHADPAAEMPAVAVAMDAELTLQSVDGHRTVHADEFFTGYYSTVRRDEEILTSVRFPAHEDLKTGFAEFSRRIGDFAIALAVASRWTQDGVPQVRLVVGGLDTRPKRIDVIEEAIRDGKGWRELCTPSVLASFTDPTDDIHASADYRLHLGAEMMRRAVRQMEGPED